MKRKVVAIIQARMASSRLPGKVLMDIEGMAMLGRVVARTRHAKSLEDVVVATSTDASDDAIFEYCSSNDIRSMRGSHFDVLDRYYRAAQQSHADVVVRVTGDCPLIEPTLIDEAVHVLLRGEQVPGGVGSPALSRGFDFVANRLPPPWSRTYPIGLDTEVCPFAVLERAWREARESIDREHVMPYLYRGVHLTPPGAHVTSGTSSHGFRIAILNHHDGFGSYRWTVDTAEDLEFVREIYRHFVGRWDFSWLEVLQLLDEAPELSRINASVKHRTLLDGDGRATGVRSS
jgi:spore coat polysaccharide biosynthesis protein SpsF